MEQDYSKREIDHFMKDITGQLSKILEQTTRHNGRLTRVERILLVMGTAIVVLMATSGSELVSFIMKIVL